MQPLTVSMVIWKGLVYRMWKSCRRWNLRLRCLQISPEPCSSYLRLLLVSGPAARSSPLGLLFGSRTHQITFITPEDKRVEMKEASCSVVLETDSQQDPHTVPAIGPGGQRGPLWDLTRERNQRRVKVEIS